MNDPRSEPLRRGSPFVATSIADSPHDGHEESGQPGVAPEDSDSRAASGDSASGDSINTGNPFARQSVHSEQVQFVDGQADLLDVQWGVLDASVWASGVVVCFAAACWQLFPGGGLLVSVLGAALALTGLFSRHSVWATALLVTHAGLFILCYSRFLD